MLDKLLTVDTVYFWCTDGYETNKFTEFLQLNQIPFEWRKSYHIWIREEDFEKHKQFIFLVHGDSIIEDPDADPPYEAHHAPFYVVKAYRFLKMV